MLSGTGTFRGKRRGAGRRPGGHSERTRRGCAVDRARPLGAGPGRDGHDVAGGMGVSVRCGDDWLEFRRVRVRSTHIGVWASGRPVTPDVAERVQALARSIWPDGWVRISFHPPCFLEQGHFAGSDEARADALVELANDPAVDALWIARGGWGAARIVDKVLPRLNRAAHGKSYMGYSDAGTLLAALYARGIGRQFHGPRPVDIVREGGEAAVVRGPR